MNTQRRNTDIRVSAAAVGFSQIETRLPLKFGAETVTDVTCARAALRVTDRTGRSAIGWGETPLSVQWVWPSAASFVQRQEALKAFCCRLARAWAEFSAVGHPLEIGADFARLVLPRLLAQFNQESALPEPMPWLAALVCASPFDLAAHDAYGNLHRLGVYQTYNAQFMSRDLSHFLEPAEGSRVRFAGLFPDDFFVRPRPDTLPAWHLVGGKDWLSPDEQDGPAPQDGYPALLRDWIARDGLFCLKIKLRGNDAQWDFQRLIDVGTIAIETGALWLSADFNCTVSAPDYVNSILDRLLAEQPRIYGMILYVEQPFPYDLRELPIDVHSVSARKPLFMDESAHDWELVRLGRRLGWTGVALKTCKTQSGALLSLCWAKAHGMTLMAQDLTNPRLAQIPHVLLAAHAGTIMGVETNSMQFYPEASKAEAAIHPGLFERRRGRLDLTSIRGPGLGYRLEEIQTPPFAPSATAGDVF